MSMLKNANDYHEEAARKPTDEYLKINTKERVKAILSLGKTLRRLEMKQNLFQVQFVDHDGATNFVKVRALTVNEAIDKVSQTQDIDYENTRAWQI